MINNKYNFLDVVRVFFAICIVALHTSLNVAALGSVFDWIYKEFVSLAVPIFFIISGFFLFSKDSNYEKSNLKKYIFQMLKRYMVWCIIYLPISIYEYILWDTGIIVGCILFLKNLFLVGGHFFSGHLWYILSSAYGGILFAVLRYKKVSDKALASIAIMIFLLQQLIDYIAYESANIAGYLGGAVNYVSKLISLTIKDGTLLAGFPYLVLSFFIVKYGKKISNKIAWPSLLVILILSRIITALLPGRFMQNVFLLLKSAFLFIGISRIRIPDSGIYKVLRRTSSIIYFSHRLFIFAWIYILARSAEEPGNTCFLFTLAGTVILSWIINYCYKKKPDNGLIKLLV